MSNINLRCYRGTFQSLICRCTRCACSAKFSLYTLLLVCARYPGTSPGPSSNYFIALQPPSSPSPYLTNIQGEQAWSRSPGINYPLSPKHTTNPPTLSTTPKPLSFRECSMFLDSFYISTTTCAGVVMFHFFTTRMGNCIFRHSSTDDEEVPCTTSR